MLENDRCHDLNFFLVECGDGWDDDVVDDDDDEEVEATSYPNGGIEMNSSANINEHGRSITGFCSTWSCRSSISLSFSSSTFIKLQLLLGSMISVKYDRRCCCCCCDDE